MTLATAKPQRPRPAKRRTPADGPDRRLIDQGAWFLVLPERLRTDIPPHSWETTTFGEGIYGVPFLQEPRVLIANAGWLRESGVRLPTPEDPWTWAEFREVAKELSGAGRYGVAWPLKEPVSATLNLSLSAGGQLFHRDADGKVEVRFEGADAVVPKTVRDAVNTDGSAPATTLCMGGSGRRKRSCTRRIVSHTVDA